MQRLKYDCGPEPVAYARALCTLCVPPYSEALVPVAVPWRYNGSSVLLEPDPATQFTVNRLAVQGQLLSVKIISQCAALQT